MLTPNPTPVQYWSGFIQVCKVPIDSSGNQLQHIYDDAAGVYPVAMNLSASTSLDIGTYRYQWTKAGLTDTNASPLLMFALPHHLESFADTADLASVATPLRLQTTTKGVATAIKADQWILTEPRLPTDLSFAPWSPYSLGFRSGPLSPAAVEVINRVALTEIDQNMGDQTKDPSMVGNFLNTCIRSHSDRVVGCGDVSGPITFLWEVMLPVPNISTLRFPRLAVLGYADCDVYSSTLMAKRYPNSLPWFIRFTFYVTSQILLMSGWAN